ncbi:MAG TPA: hypothetical protein VG649_16570 [Candidatus Angelobacter sp.]|nr:hypothetical protein [Candidatus Angelobacter sp.]
MSKLTDKIYPILRRDFDTMLQRFAPTFAETIVPPDSPYRNDPHVLEISRLQRELGESFWRAGVLIANTLPKAERGQELDRIERKLRSTAWPNGSFPRTSSSAEFDLGEYRREMKRLAQINRQLVAECTSSLKARRKRPASASRTPDQQWKDFQELINNSRIFDSQTLQGLPADQPEVKVLLKLLHLQGDSLWHLALILTSHMEKTSQQAELDKTERQLRNLGWTDLRFKRPGFFFRPSRAQFPKELKRFEQINLALESIVGLPEDFDPEDFHDEHG